MRFSRLFFALVLSGCYAHHERCVAEPQIDLGEGATVISCSSTECEILPGCILELDDAGLLPGACMVGEYELSWEGAERVGSGTCSTISSPARLYRYFGTDARGTVDDRTYERTLVLTGV